MGGILGGGGSSSTQQSSNKTTVNVENQIANVIDLGVIAEALKATSANTQELIASISKAQIIAQIASVQEKAKQNEVLKDGLKYGGIGIAGYFIYKEFYK